VEEKLVLKNVSFFYLVTVSAEFRSSTGAPRSVGRYYVTRLPEHQIEVV
jgi:hypothetical protein